MLDAQIRFADDQHVSTSRCVDEFVLRVEANRRLLDRQERMAFTGGCNSLDEIRGVSRCVER